MGSWLNSSTEGLFYSTVQGAGVIPAVETSPIPHQATYPPPFPPSFRYIPRLRSLKNPIHPASMHGGHIPDHVYPTSPILPIHKITVVREPIPTNCFNKTIPSIEVLFHSEKNISGCTYQSQPIEQERQVKFFSPAITCSGDMSANIM